MKHYESHKFIVDKIKSIEPKLAFHKDCDYHAWSKEAREKLEELLGLPFESCDDKFAILDETDMGTYKQISFEFQSEEGYFVPGEFLMPKAAVGKVPVAICLQGHSSGRHISLGKAKFESDADLLAGRDFAVQAAKEGYAAVAIDQRYMGAAGQGTTGTPGCIVAGQALPTLLIGRTAIGERVWDVMRLIDVLIAHFSEYIDESKIVCMGNSGGGTATFYAACLEDRISLAMPSCAVCTYEASIVEIHHCSCNYVPGIRKYFNMGDLGCLIAPRKLVVVCGIHDEIFPLHGVEESFGIMERGFKALGKEGDCRLVKGDGGHQFYPDDAWPVVKEMLG